MKLPPTPVSIENADHYRWGKECDGWHLLDRSDLSVIQERMPAGTSEQMHYHKHSRQFFFVLEGAATMEFEGSRLLLAKGQGVEIPPGIRHRLCNESRENLSFLVFSVPKSHGDRYDVGRG